MKLTEYDISHPYKATVVRSERITPESTDEVRHIVLSIPDATFHHLEGQSIGVLVPGPHAFGNEYHLRLYSIASTRQGENSNMSEISLCVRRCFYIDEVSGERYPGVASNFLCDRRAGEPVELTGPYGRHFLPPRDNTCNMLMIGVGTGIAPFRAFIKHIYDERKEWKGKVRLFYGARTGMDLLYMNDSNGDLSNYYDQATFKAFEALSPRPHANAPEEVESTIKANAKEVWELIEDPKTYTYVSGLTKLEEKLDKVLADLAGSPEKWAAKKKELIAAGRWSTLFYD
ncbi:MAG: hypothetical protein R3F07_11030 [Opitutaceae bacterium]